MTDHAADARPVLNRSLLAQRPSVDAALPPYGWNAPETVVQFGTGAFLRGFVGHFLDEARRQGRLRGSVVMVGSTVSGRDGLFAQQDGLYTLITRGSEGGAARSEARVIGVVSRVLAAATQWREVLSCAVDPSLELIFSNTTETGIALDEHDSFDATPPRSFPGKLTRFLYERATAFDCDPARAPVVLPCELIEDNGTRLREIVLQLAGRWRLGARFETWISESVTFCNTLVDRIVPGTPERPALAEEWTRLGYTDELLTVAEIYRSFVIEGDDALARRLAFAGADPGVLIVADVRPYRERKVRLLNGTHSAMAAVALLGGCATVSEALEHERIGAFVRAVLLDEIVRSLDVPDADTFALAVLDRFANPFIRHSLFDITLQYTTKLRVRIVPSIIEYTRRFDHAPAGLALGFAAWLLFMRGDLQQTRRAAGLPVPADDFADRLRQHWSRHGTDGVGPLVTSVCADTTLWQHDLSTASGFVAAVAEHLARMLDQGVDAALDAYITTHVQPGSAS